MHYIFLLKIALQGEYGLYSRPGSKFLTGYNKYLINVSFHHQQHYDYDDCKDGRLFPEKENNEPSKDQRVRRMHTIWWNQRAPKQRAVAGKGTLRQAQHSDSSGGPDRLEGSEHFSKLPIPILTSNNQTFVKPPEKPSLIMGKNTGSSPLPEFKSILCHLGLCNLQIFPKHSVPPFFHL